MAKTKKTIFRRNLAKYDVLVEDTSLPSPYFQITNLPPKFAGGRNSFLLGGSYLLQNKSKVLVEILDANGNAIYNNIVPDYTEANSKLVSAEVYDTTAVGFATIIIMAKAITLADGTPIPPEWQNKYNVRWTRRVLVDYYSDNTSPLRFVDNPAVFVEENRFNNIYNPRYTLDVVDLPVTLTPLLLSSMQTGYVLRTEPTTPFSSEYFGGILTGSLRVNSREYNVALPIENILNKTTAFSPSYLIGSPNDFIKEIRLESGSYHTPVAYATAAVTSSIQLQYPILEEPTVNAPTSFANIRVVNLNSVSGELHKVRVYQKSTTDAGEFKLIADVPTTTQELLTTPTARGPLPYGIFYRAPAVGENWIAGDMVQNTDITSAIYPMSGSSAYYTGTGGTYPLQISDDTLLSGMYAEIPTSGNSFSSPVSTLGYFIGNVHPTRIFPTTEYTLRFTSIYQRSSGSVILGGNTPKLDIYMIGDVIGDNPLGQLLGSIQPSADIEFYENKEFNFVPRIPNASSVYLRFVITNGFWQFSNISLSPAEDIRFSPDEIQFYVPNTDYHKQVLQYKIEFFTIDNNSTPISAVSEPTFFTGSVVDLGLLPTIP
jgi:hypothetical protein